MQAYECILYFIRGIGVLILAMKLMCNILKEIEGERMTNFIIKFVDNRIKCISLGFLITAFFQSRSITTLLIISFVNANAMDLYQAVTIYIGANIGSISQGFFPEKFNLSLYLSILVFFGIMLYLKKIKKI